MSSLHRKWGRQKQTHLPSYSGDCDSTLMASSPQAQDCVSMQWKQNSFAFMLSLAALAEYEVVADAPAASQCMHCIC